MSCPLSSLSLGKIENSFHLLPVCICGSFSSYPPTQNTDCLCPKRHPNTYASAPLMTRAHRRLVYYVGNRVPFGIQPMSFQRRWFVILPLTLFIWIWVPYNEIQHGSCSKFGCPLPLTFFPRSFLFCSLLNYFWQMYASVIKCAKCMPFTLTQSFIFSYEWEEKTFASLSPCKWFPCSNSNVHDENECDGRVLRGN